MISDTTIVFHFHSMLQKTAGTHNKRVPADNTFCSGMRWTTWKRVENPFKTLCFDVTTYVESCWKTSTFFFLLARKKLTLLSPVWLGTHGDSRPLSRCVTIISVPLGWVTSFLSREYRSQLSCSKGSSNIWETFCTLSKNTRWAFGVCSR